ncbi:MAG TPA: DUF2332 domain-containing protein [Solirubrobacterales bacterium]|nr:DUF2332 domain-containing protein [Solirubrobacterales bacterium]
MKTEQIDPSGDLAARLRTQAGHCARLGSDLYAGLLERAAADVEAGGPTAQLLRGHEDDPADSMLALRLMGAVNRRLLEGALPDLEPLYRQADAGAAWPVLRRALSEDAEAVRGLLERPVQTNEVGRCAALLPGFLAVTTATGLPLRLLEVGASAGLNLRWDRYRYEAEGFAWGDPGSPVRLGFELEGAAPEPVAATVAERRGCDRSPIDPTSPDGRLTLLAYLWPDQANRLERVRAAIDLAAEVPVEIDRSAAAEWIGPRLAEAPEGLTTVVFHSIVMLYLPEAERLEFERLVAEAGQAASERAPLAWLRMEAAGERAAVRLTTWPGGEDRLLALASYHGDLVEMQTEA